MEKHEHSLLAGFIPLLEGNKADDAAAYALSLLEFGQLTVPELYEQVLAPALNRIEVPREREAQLIWREHMESAIVQRIIGACYPYVQKEKALSGGNNAGIALLASPEEEYHEIGLRMGADYFTILGYKVVYIGCNTPREALLDAVGDVKPDILALGVTNYLNLIQLPALVSAIRVHHPALRIYISGSALRHTGKQASDFLANDFIASFEDVRKLKEEAK